MVVEIDVPGPQAVASDELFVARRPLILGIARQHALETHADTLDVLYRAPSLLSQEIEADDAVRVDVRMYGYGSIG